MFWPLTCIVSLSLCWCILFQNYSQYLRYLYEPSFYIFSYFNLLRSSTEQRCSWTDDSRSAGQETQKVRYGKIQQIWPKQRVKQNCGMWSTKSCLVLFETRENFHWSESNLLSQLLIQRMIKLTAVVIKDPHFYINIYPLFFWQGRCNWGSFNSSWIFVWCVSCSELSETSILIIDFNFI